MQIGKDVTLVDTAGQGVDRITAKGVVVGDREYELDCIIFATGFEVGTEFTSRAGYEIHGRDGMTISEKWKQGVTTMHGMHVHGFPNCFFVLNNVQSGITINFPLSLDEQGKHVAHIIRTAGERQVRAVEVTAGAEREWVDTILSTAAARLKFLQECTPGYYNDEGRVTEIALRAGGYRGGWAKFQKVLEDWRAAAEMPGMDVRN